MAAFAQIVAYLFLPSLVLGLGCGVGWRFTPPGPQRSFLQWAAALLFFVPQPLVLFLGNWSVELYTYQQMLLAVWGFGVAIMVLAQLMRGTATPAATSRLARWRATETEIEQTEAVLQRVRSGSRTRGPLPKIVAALVCLGLGTFCSWHLIGDHLFAPQVVDGHVEGARIRHGSRSPSSAQVILDGRPYNITWDLLAQLHRGEEIRATVGAGSGTVLRYEEVGPTH